MNTEIIYTATNTSLQAIDTFSLPEEVSLRYSVRVQSKNEKSISVIDVVHDGTETGETQHGMSQSNLNPIVMTTDILDYEGRLLVQPTETPTTFFIFRDTLLANLYSESTVSGVNIVGNSGIGIDYTSAINTMTIRQSNNNFYGDPAEFVVADTLGPIQTLDELLVNGWNPQNGSVLVSENTSVIVVQSSGRFDNYQYQEIDVEPNKLYRISGSASHVLGDDTIVRESSFALPGVPFIRIGSTLGGFDYLNYKTEETETTFDSSFITTGSKVYLMVGYGLLNSEVTVNNISLKRSAPFHTFDEDQGTIYLSWDAVGVGNTLLSFTSLDGSTQSIVIDSSNSIIISFPSENVNCGSQDLVNKLAFSYSNNEVISSLNGNAVQSNLVTEFITNVDSVTFNIEPRQFSYSANPVSNSELIGLSDV